MNCSTWMTDFSGSVTWKYKTASTLTETLSREIRSWLGTSMTTVRKSTRTICWKNGTSRIKPGPLTLEKRPSVNMTARSYSRMILIDAFATSKSTTIRNNGISNPVSILISIGVVEQYVCIYRDSALLANVAEQRRRRNIAIAHRSRAACVHTVFFWTSRPSECVYTKAMKQQRPNDFRWKRLFCTTMLIT